jgi:hypothetical protein
MYICRTIAEATVPAILLTLDIYSATMCCFFYHIFATAAISFAGGGVANCLQTTGPEKESVGYTCGTLIMSLYLGLTIDTACIPGRL